MQKKLFSGGGHNLFECSPRLNKEVFGVSVINGLFNVCPSHCLASSFSVCPLLFDYLAFSTLERLATLFPHPPRWAAQTALPCSAPWRTVACRGTSSCT